jgi:hypothetical protein
MNDILKSLKNFDPLKSQGFSEIPNFVLSRCQLSISKFLYVLFDEILKRTEIPVKMKVNLDTPVGKLGKDKKFLALIDPSLSAKIFIKFLNISFLRVK